MIFNKQIRYLSIKIFINLKIIKLKIILVQKWKFWKKIIYILCKKSFNMLRKKICEEHLIFWKVFQKNFLKFFPKLIDLSFNNGLNVNKY